MKKDAALYQAFGFIISSELELPPLPLAQEQDAVPDINIAIGPVDINDLSDPPADEGWYQASPMQFLMHIPDVAWFMVKHGNSIVIAPENGSDEQSVVLFLLGSCMGVILHQRNMLVIHGNAIRFGDYCVVFAGPSGIGKSTLAAAFHRLGHEILADDVCAIDAMGRAVSSYPQLKLWQDAAAKLKISTSGLNKIRYQAKKFAYPLQRSFQTALPVAAIYILSSNNKNEFRTEALEGMNKFIALRDNTYRMEYLDGLGLKAEHLQQCSKLAAKIHMSRISRPEHGFKLDQLVDFILADLQNKGIAAA